MSIRTVEAAARWIRNIHDSRITITFHGGEPLLAGAEFYRKALPLLAGELAQLNPEFALQSNLWKMTPELATVLAEYNIPIGSSLDGPKEINDLQRGDGYFDKTMNGYRIAVENGLNVRFICTFTSQSIEQKEEIFRFYLENGYTLKLHPALPSLRSSDPQKWALSPEKYGELLVFLLDRYLEHIGEIEVMNINDLCRCVFTRRGSVCTYADCMGNTFAIGPDGNIYPCYRFVGMPEYSMGNVHENPTMEDLAETDAWKLMFRFKEFVDTNCKECSHIRYCRGGCPYNAMAPTDGEVKGVDPHCPAYKRIFDEINNRLNDEMFNGPPMMGLQNMNPHQKPGIMRLIQQVVMR